MTRFIAVVPHQIDLARHRKQRFRVLVFDSELEGPGVVHGMNYGLVFQAMGGVVESGGFTQEGIIQTAA
ncbi:FolC bifunctional protein [Pseudomonas sp. StFLB209]|nr:FolC bifunctional protein [Pseudomonas sp. StFLB209]BAP44413.1 FolC bifunctional protein [Pseudomonas sp. StFLB209]